MGNYFGNASPLLPFIVIVILVMVIAWRVARLIKLFQDYESAQVAKDKNEDLMAVYVAARKALFSSARNTVAILLVIVGLLLFSFYGYGPGQSVPEVPAEETGMHQMLEADKAKELPRLEGTGFGSDSEYQKKLRMTNEELEGSTSERKDP